MQKASGSKVVYYHKTALWFSIAAVMLLLVLSGLFPVLLPIASTNNGNSSGSSAASQSQSSALATSMDSSSWLTYHNDNARDGYSNSLPAINSPSVAWTASVDGAVYAEPLYYNGLAYIATEGDNVYALNATTGAVVWSENLGTPANSLAPPLECNGNGPDIKPVIGITGTPVIDPSTNTIYIAALISGTGYLLFALNAGNGHQNWYSSITAPGFHYLAEEQRGALALANGFVYVPFGGYSWNCFTPGPTGWVMAMSPSGAGEQHAYNVPTKIEGDIWAPEGVTIDSTGSVYVVTGDSNNVTFDLGNSVIKLSPDLNFVNSTANYFAPANWEYTNTNDLDLGSTGLTLLPNNLGFAIGKDGVGYLLSTTNLGGKGGELFSANVCTAGYAGAWGSTSYANGVIYVPCGSGLVALKLVSGTNPSFSVLWTFSGIFAGPAIIAGGSVWTVSITEGTLYQLDPLSGAVQSQKSLRSVEHFTTPSAGDGMLFLATGSTVYGLGSSSSGTGGTSKLTVSSQNTNGQVITGYYTILYSSSNSVLGTGFTPATFTLNNGASYNVQVDNYGSCNFAYWLDTGGTNSYRQISIASNTDLTAVYNCGGGSGSSSSLTVNSVNQNGNAINGYYVILYNSGGSVLATGFTPKTFSTTSGDTYSVQVDNYGSCVFSQWSDGVTSNPRTFTATSSQEMFTAQYNCGGTKGSGSSTISVSTVNSHGSPINGYYTTLWENGKQVASCFSACSFTVNNGQTYQVEVSNYGAESFSHWQNGSTERMYTVAVPSSSSEITLTAYYTP